MNRLLVVLIALLVVGIGLSRANDILIALSPYPSAVAEAPAPPAATPLAAELPSGEPLPVQSAGF